MHIDKVNDQRTIYSSYLFFQRRENKQETLETVHLFIILMQECHKIFRNVFQVLFLNKNNGSRFDLDFF